MRLACDDFTQGLRQYRLWLHLGWMELLQRYRRSLLGPWWLTISMLLFISMMSLVFSQLFQESLDEYVPFFTAGYLFWTFISNTLIESGDIFKSNSPFIKQSRLPYNLYIFKHLVRQSICLLHNSAVYLLVCLYFQKNPGLTSLLAIPGFLLLLANLYWVCLLSAMVSTRYRDMIPMIAACMQIAFFTTPVSWMPRLLNTHSAWLRFNPFVYFLDLVRSPLLGAAPSLSSWLVCGVLALIGSSLTLALFSALRPRIVFWVD